MRIGIFDSGLGGLLVTHALSAVLSRHDLVYLGDTLRVPYGDRSQEAIYRFTAAAVDYLFREQDCALIVLACNTASAEALRRIQQEYLPGHYPDRRVLGVIIPTAEAVTSERVGLLATRSTVSSGAFVREITKLKPGVVVTQQAAPLLVPLIENNGLQWATPIIESYVAPLRTAGITELILGCTHYGLARDLIAEALPGTRIITQEDVVPPRLLDYLTRHPEMAKRLSQNSERTYLLTDVLPHYEDLSETLTGSRVHFEHVELAV